jgi:hypothetical protein
LDISSGVKFDEIVKSKMVVEHQLLQLLHPFYHGCIGPCHTSEKFRVHSVRFASMLTICQLDIADEFYPSPVTLERSRSGSNPGKRG